MWIDAPPAFASTVEWALLWFARRERAERLRTAPGSPLRLVPAAFAALDSIVAPARAWVAVRDAWALAEGLDAEDAWAARDAAMRERYGEGFRLAPEPSNTGRASWGAGGPRAPPSRGVTSTRAPPPFPFSRRSPWRSLLLEATHGHGGRTLVRLGWGKDARPSRVFAEIPSATGGPGR